MEELSQDKLESEKGEKLEAQHLLLGVKKGDTRTHRLRTHIIPWDLR